MNISNQIQILKELHEHNLKLYNLLNDLENGQPIVRYNEVRDSLESTKKDLEENFKRLKKLENQESLLEEKLNNLKKQASVVNSHAQSIKTFTEKQYESITHELDFIEKEIDITQDKGLEVLDEIALVNEEIKNLEKRLKSLEEIERTHRQQVDEFRDSIKLSIQKEEKVVSDLKARLDKSLLDTYNSVFGRNPVGAVARIENMMCQSCYVGLSATMVNAVNTGDELVFCEQCGAILISE